MSHLRLLTAVAIRQHTAALLLSIWHQQNYHKADPYCNPSTSAEWFLSSKCCSSKYCGTVTWAHASRLGVSTSTSPLLKKLNFLPQSGRKAINQFLFDSRRFYYTSISETAEEVADINQVFLSSCLQRWDSWMHLYGSSFIITRSSCLWLLFLGSPKL